MWSICYGKCMVNITCIECLGYCKTPQKHTEHDIHEKKILFSKKNRILSQFHKSNGIQVFGTNIRHSLGSKRSLKELLVEGRFKVGFGGWLTRLAKVRTAKLPVLPRIVTSKSGKLGSGKN